MTTSSLLPARAIGGLSVSAIGLGCMGLSSGYGPPVEEADGVRLLNHALDAGVTFLDTAAIYGLGGNERLINKAVMHRRDAFLLASKGVFDVIDGKRVLDGSPATITGSLDRSLQRLGTDHIDLYYLHRLDAKVPIEESVGALVRAIEAGKIRAIGLSEMSAATIRRAHAVHPVTAVQSEYSPIVRNPEVAVLETCRELGIGFVAFSPVGRQMLAGVPLNGDYARGDIRQDLPRFCAPHVAANMVLADGFSALSGEAGVTPAQLALGWVLSRGSHVVPIPGTTSIAHLDEDLAAAHMTFAPDLLAAVDALFPANALEGPRYGAAMQALIETERLPEEVLS
ncbi:aldo/keto reductase [Sphingobium aromaticiconvertens]|uniref:aldo/keto reductase n=1 Tax=Sphingobium aromaticiconvertens TaxID=365341 RepID=UPI00301AD882